MGAVAVPVTVAKRLAGLGARPLGFICLARLAIRFMTSKRSPGVKLVGVLYAASATFETFASGRSEGATVPLSLASTVRVT